MTASGKARQDIREVDREIHIKKIKPRDAGCPMFLPVSFRASRADVNLAPIIST